MDEFRFATPWMLLLLALAPLVLLAAWPARRRGAVRMGSLSTVAALRPTWRVRFEPALIMFRIGAIVLLVLALARPQRGEATAETEGEGIDIVLAFDVSTSMTQLFGGNRTRLDAAKEVLSGFLEGRENDRVGLVAFQGSSITLSPLTTDYRAVDDAVQRADLLQLADGTAIGTAMGESVNVLRGSTAASRIVILMTDGENNAGNVEPLAAARIAERLGARVYTVGVVGRAFGESATINVDERALREIADVTGGTYNRAEDPQALEQIYERIDQLETSQFEGDELIEFDDVAQWFLAAAALLLAIELVLRSSVFRRVA